MRSPFPGMDPYLEDRWRDVHQRIVTYISDQLQPQVTPRYVARIEDRVVLDSADEDRGTPTYYPDVKVVRQRRTAASEGGATAVAGGLAVAEPHVVSMAPSEITESFVEIIDARSGGTVVTVIELLSPSNKRAGKDRNDYLKKQRDLLASDASLVEIDLLRGGIRTLLYDTTLWPARLRQHYAACVSRPDDERRAELYGFTLRERLPAIRIPLRVGDPDVFLDLQSLVEKAYANGGHGVDLDYVGPPAPPLSPDDEAWADALLRAAGKRA